MIILAASGSGRGGFTGSARPSTGTSERRRPRLVSLIRRRESATNVGHPRRFDVAEAYDVHGGVIFGFALNALDDRGSAEECVQETFTRAWRARDSYDARQASQRTWLFAIARNVIKDSYRRRARAPRTVDDSRLRDVSAAEPDPDQSLIMTEALASLSSDQRQAIVAIHVVGVSYAELSDAVDVPVATLRSRTFYGLRALRRHLEGEEGIDE